VFTPCHAVYQGILCGSTLKTPKVTVASRFANDEERGSVSAIAAEALMNNVD
jgi:hypothetical protein